MLAVFAGGEGGSFFEYSLKVQTVGKAAKLSDSRQRNIPLLDKLAGKVYPLSEDVLKRGESRGFSEYLPIP